jgi:hypothetical protein
MCVRDLLLHFSVHLTERECDVGWKGSCEAQEWDLYLREWPRMRYPHGKDLLSRCSMNDHAICQRKKQKKIDKERTEGRSQERQFQWERCVPSHHLDLFLFPPR